MIWEQLDARLQLVERQLASLLAREDARDTVAILERFDTLETKIMAAVDDFNAAFDKLAASVDTLSIEITALITAHNNGDDAAFQAATARVQAVQAKLDADVTAAAGTAPAVPGA